MSEEGGSPGAELKIRLVVDDQSQDVLELLKNNLEGVKEKSHEAGASVGMIAKGVAIANVGTGLLKEAFVAVGEGIHAAYEMLERFAETAIEAAGGEDDQVRSMTGLVFLLDKGQHSMASLAQYAGDVHDELEEAGRKVGQNDVAMTDTFNTLIAKGTLSTEKAKELTEQMAQVGRVTQGGMKGLGDGFAMIEMGMIRARNPIVQLIAATGQLKGNAHDVAKAMMKMTPEKQMELATKAINTQSQNMEHGGGPQMTIAEMRTSLSGYREMFFESIGHPIIDVLMPALTKVQGWIGDNRDAINRYATEIGDDIGLVVRATEEAFGGIYRSVWYNWEQISTMFERVFGDWRAAWNYSDDKGQTIYKMFRDMTTWLVDAFERIMWMAHTVGDIFMQVNDFMKDKPRGTTALETQRDAMMGRADEFGDPKAMAAFDESSRRFKAMAEEMPGISQMAVDAMTTQLRSHLEQNLKQSEELRENVGTGHYDAVSDWINSSMKNNQEAAQVYVVSLLTQSDAAMNALKTGAIHINDGMDALIKTVSEKSPEVGRAFKEALTRMQGGGIKDIAGKGALNFNMHNTQIHIKQDFKNEDPDRIALIMRRDLVHSATARVQSRATAPFGL